MSTQTLTPAGRAVRGTLRRRLLVNAVVDPDEAASRLPSGLRPHVVGSGTVVGCCLLEVDHLRPASLPAATGVTMRAAASRISAEWVDEASGEQVVGVYVPGRVTDSRLAVALGGRWFPGVHRPARVDVRAAPGRLAWQVDDDAADLGLHVVVSWSHGGPAVTDGDPVGVTCLGATLGLSPTRHGGLEAARMEPGDRRARPVVVEELDSTFLSGFATASPAPAYLMEGVAVAWSAARS